MGRKCWNEWNSHHQDISVCGRSALDSVNTESSNENRQTLQRKDALAVVVGHLGNAPSKIA